MERRCAQSRATARACSLRLPPLAAQPRVPATLAHCAERKAVTRAHHAHKQAERPQAQADAAAKAVESAAEDTAAQMLPPATEAEKAAAQAEEAQVDPPAPWLAQGEALYGPGSKCAHPLPCAMTQRLRAQP